MERGKRTFLLWRKPDICTLGRHPGGSQPAKTVGGVTAVLVSHSPTDIIQFCDRAAWLHRGEMKKLGPSKEVMETYLEFLEDRDAEKLEKARAERIETAKKKRKRPAKASEGEGSGLYGPIYDDFDRIDGLEVSLLVKGRESDSIKVHDEVVIRYQFTLLEKVNDLNVSLVLCRKDGLRLTTISTLNGDLSPDQGDAPAGALRRCVCVLTIGSAGSPPRAPAPQPGPSPRGWCTP